MIIINYLLTESEVFTGKSQTEALRKNKARRQEAKFFRFLSPRFFIFSRTVCRASSQLTEHLQEVT